MLHHGKHAPVPTILRPVAGIKFEILCITFFTIYQFKHLLHYLCSIVNKIWAHVIWKSFSFHIIKIKKNIPTFPEFGCTTLLLPILFIHWWASDIMQKFSKSVPIKEQIQFKYICIALFYDIIVAKQLYRKLSFHNIFTNCNLIYLTYGKLW